MHIWCVYMRVVCMCIYMCICCMHVYMHVCAVCTRFVSMCVLYVCIHMKVYACVYMCMLYACMLNTCVVYACMFDVWMCYVLYACVLLYVCVLYAHVWCVYVCTYMCEDYKLMWESFSIMLQLIFGTRVSHWIWRSPVQWTNWPVTACDPCASTTLPNTGAMDTQHATAYESQGSNSGFHAYKASALPLNHLSSYKLEVIIHYLQFLCWGVPLHDIIKYTYWLLNSKREQNHGMQPGFVQAYKPGIVYSIQYSGIQ